MQTLFLYFANNITFWIYNICIMLLGFGNNYQLLHTFFDTVIPVLVTIWYIYEGSNV
jgi:hypothetical protein